MINEPDNSIVAGRQEWSRFVQLWRDGYCDLPRRAMTAGDAREAASEAGAPKAAPEAAPEAAPKAAAKAAAKQIEDTAEDWRKWIVQGARVQCCIGGPADEGGRWFGALCDGEIADGSAFYFGFDDGDAVSYTIERLSDVAKPDQNGCVCIKPLDPSMGGLVKSEATHLGCVGFTKHKFGSIIKHVGVLIGYIGMAQGRMLNGNIIYAGHVVDSKAFSTTRGDRSSNRVPTSASVQDRLGFHTFKEGNHVEYLQLKAGEASPVVIVVGLLIPSAVGADQGRKYLILFDQGADVLFIGSWC